MRGVVLAEYSQGSVIATAVLWQQQAADADLVPTAKVSPRLAFSSYGYVLSRLYANVLAS
jgi:hypothetical protein